MKLIVALFAVIAFAQTPGTVTQTTTTQVSGVAGNVTCTLTSVSPKPLTGIHTECVVSGAKVLTMDSVIPVGPNGVVGSLLWNGDSVSWILTQPTAGPI